MAIFTENMGDVLNACRDVGGNYIELHIGQVTSDHEFRYALNRDYFDKLINAFSRKYDRAFEHDFMETVKGNTVLVRKFEEGNIIETRVNNMQILQQRFDDTNGLNIIVYDKKKVPVIMFPSTTSVHSVKYVRKLIFRVNNRVYVNIQEEKVADDMTDMYYRAYINVNYSDGIDSSDITQKLSCILAVLSEIPKPTF